MPEGTHEYLQQILWEYMKLLMWQTTNKYFMTFHVMTGAAVV